MNQFTCKGVKQINNRISLNRLVWDQSRSKYYLRTKFQDGIDKPQKCRNVCYHPTHQQIDFGPKQAMTIQSEMNSLHV
jgi:hypothetical protein